MQSGGSGGGPARNPGMGPGGRTNSTSSAASPSSSSSSVQQLASRQVKDSETQLKVDLVRLEEYSALSLNWKYLCCLCANEELR